MRNLRFPLTMHKNNCSAVIDVDYSPTGKEFVSAGYDKTIRIYEVDKVLFMRLYVLNNFRQSENALLNINKTIF